MTDHVQAAECMGLPHAEDAVEDSAKRFSDDVLRVEITGPQQDHLSFVDIPGLFHSKLTLQARVEGPLTSIYRSNKVPDL